MKLLFIKSLLEGDYSTLKIKLFIVAVMWMFVFIAIAIDLRSGYKKAKLRGEARTSYGLKRTISKVNLYYTALFFAFMLDVIIDFVITSFDNPVPPIPFVTIIASLYLIYVEGRSVFEKAEDKEKIRLSKNLDDIVTLIENKDDLLTAVSEIIKKSKENKPEKKEDNEDGKG